MSKKRKPLQRRLSKRNHAAWARWYIETYEEEFDAMLKEKFGLELEFTTREKEQFIKQILKAYWNMITTTLFINNEEIYWARRAGKDKKLQLVLAFIVDGLNRSYEIEYQKNEKRRREEYKAKRDNKT